MELTYEKEVTITDIDKEYGYLTNVKGIFYVCSPDINGHNQLILLQSHSKYDYFRQELKSGTTFNITINNDAMIQTISQPIERIIVGEVKEISRLRDELQCHYFYLSEITIENFNGRLLCGARIKDKIMTDESYKFTYVKDYGDNKYRIIKAEEC
jgi:hypothetical protein